MNYHGETRPMILFYRHKEINRNGVQIWSREGIHQ